MDILIALNNVEVLFLPPNTTSKIPPMDAEIIASIKVRYSGAQMERAVDLADEAVSDIYKICILSAMYALKHV